MLPAGTMLVIYLVLQRLTEMVFAAANTKRLLASGGFEVGRAHYPFIVALHAAWLTGLVVLGHDRQADPRLLLLFCLLQAVRLWVIATLGRRWTTRVIVLPGERLIEEGPYRFLRHPNYLVVSFELAVVPLALGMPLYAAAFTALNAVLLSWRIWVEGRALNTPRNG